VFRIGRFWERPHLPLAEKLLVRGCLWNSLVMVGSVKALLLLFRDTVRRLYRSFVDVAAVFGTPEEADAMAHVYAQIESTDFRSQVLSVCPQILSVLPVADAGWTELGETNRALPLVARNRTRTGSTAVL
jgi:mannose-1-phosphate guanylyltransferase